MLKPLFEESLPNIESPSLSRDKQQFCVHCTSCDVFAHSANADPLLPLANHCCKHWWQILITCSPRLFKLESACSRNGNKRENEKKKKKEARRSLIGNKEKEGSSAVCYYGKGEDSGMVETAAYLNSLRTLHE